METLMSFSSFSSLLNFLNIILIGVVVFFTMNKYVYIIDVVSYALAKTFIPIITNLMFSSIFNSSVSITIGTIFIMLILNFLLGLIVIKLVEKVGSNFSYDAIISFIIIFAIVDAVVLWAFSFIINLLF